MEKLKEILMKYFSIGDSDYFWCQRDKSAFIIGTMTLDDFIEMDESMIDDLIEYIVKNYRKEN